MDCCNGNTWEIFLKTRDVFQKMWVLLGRPILTDWLQERKLILWKKEIEVSLSAGMRGKKWEDGNEADLYDQGLDYAEDLSTGLYDHCCSVGFSDP